MYNYGTPGLPNQMYFTIAKTGGWQEDTPPDLLFYSPNWDAASIEALALAPQLPQTLGPKFMLFRSQAKNIIVATPNFQFSLTQHILRPSSIAPPLTQFLLHTSDQELQTIKLADIYNSCSNPLKYGIACRDCLLDTENTKPKCLYQQLCDYSFDEMPYTLAELHGELQSRKSKLVGFTYVSPALTSEVVIASAFRPLDEHDFRYVERNTECRKDAQTERNRYKNFRKEVCPDCAFEAICKHDTSYNTRSCKGAYTKTETDIAKEILSNVSVPFTEKQLLYLLYNSGELEKRYNRRKYTATLCISHKFPGKIQFCLIRNTKPSWYDDKNIIIDTFEEAKEILEKYGNYQLPPESICLTPIQKATLFELLAQQESPRKRTSWPSTVYDTLCTSLYRRNIPTFEQRYSWGGGRGLLPWSVHVENLADIYENFATLKFASKNRNSLRRYR